MKVAMVSVPVDDPVKAHAFYTDTLGFESNTFSPDDQLAVVVSAEAPDGTALLLEPRGEGFAKAYQQGAYEAGLPIIVFSVSDLVAAIERLTRHGVAFRKDLDRPEWGLENLFEDTCGNLIMLQQAE